MQLAELLTLPANELKALFGDTTYRRGLTYFNQGRVEQVEIYANEDDGGVVNGLVRGNGRKPYQVEVIAQDSFHTDLLSSCTCPVGYLCKHAVALTLHVQAMFNKVLEETQANPLESWLAGLDELAAPPPPPSAPGKVSLIYLLSLREHHGREYLSLDTARAQHLKRGGLGKPQPVTLRRVAGQGGNDYGYGYGFNRYGSPPRPDYITPEDEAIARLALALDSDKLPNGTSFSGDASVVLLRRLLATGRCHYETPQNPPLLEGPPRELKFEWHTLDGDQLRLLPRLEGLDAWLPLPTTPAWYLDLQSWRCGPVSSELPDAMLQHLERLPDLDAEAQVRFSEAMQTRLPASFPLPSKVEIERIELPLQPQLRLFGVDNGRTRMPMVEPSFCYGEHCLTVDPQGPAPQSRIRAEGRTLLIQRDTGAETAAIERLLDQRLITVDGGMLGLHGRLLLVPTPSERDEDDLHRRIWAAFYAYLPQLEADGWRIIHDLEQPSVEVSEAETFSGQVSGSESDNDWFEIGLSIEVEGESVPLLPLMAQLLSNTTPQDDSLPLVVELGPNHWVSLESARVRPLLDALLELYDAPLGDDGTLRLPRTRAGVVGQLEESLGEGAIDTRDARAIRELGEKLRHFDGIATVPPPPGLQADLRGYQQRGLDWLAFLRDYGLGGLLADDMGLGKTLQTLALLLHEKVAGRLDRPALVVCPTSLLGNWRREAERFAPALKVLEWHGPQRSRELSELADHDLVITNYPLLARDGDFLAALPLHYLICDEAQQLKNPRALASQAARNLQTRHRLALTGTPMENHLGELWSLFDLVMPGFLWDEKRFNRLLRHPIEKQGDAERRAQLVQRVAPFMLRRTKGEVANELPPKTEIIRLVELGTEQRRLYETIRVAMADKVQKLLADKGLQRARIEILDALLKLRQVCCDPQLVKTASARKVQESAKLELLMEMLPEMLEEGRRILLFSQFTSMLGLIEGRLGKAGIAYTKLTGQTRKRQAAIERFTSGEVSLFLISLKAGGTGLNLTEADTVIHYDPWWNPAVEAQATDRAHRIGQDKPVFVYKLLAEATLEEKILAMQQRKQALADAVYAKGEGQDAFELDAAALSELFSA